MATLLAHWMTPKGFGAFVVSYHSVRLIALITSFGLGQAGLHYLPRLYKQKSFSEFRGYFRFGLATNAWAPCLATAVILALTPWVTSHPSGRQIEILLPLASVLACNVFLGGILRGLGHPLVANLSTGALREGLLMVFVFGFYREGDAVSDVGALRSLLWASCIMLAMQVIVFRRHREVLTGRAEYYGRKWLQTSFPTYWLAILRLLISTAEILLVGALVGEVEAGSYHLAMTWAAWALIPFTAAGSIYPRTLVLASRHRAPRLIRISMHRSLKMSLTLSPVILLAAFLVMMDLSAVHKMALELLIPLYLARMAGGWAILLVSNAMAFGRSRALVRAATLITFISILISYFLCLHIGVFGVAVGYLVTRILACGVYRYVVYEEVPGLR